MFKYFLLHISLYKICWYIIMLDGFFDKILSLSGRYTHYKSECARLNDKCEMLEKDNDILRGEVKELLLRLDVKQDKLYSLIEENELVNDTDKILDAMISIQHHMNNGFDENMKLLESLDDSMMRVEKSSSYTNVKLDSKFDENKRLIMDEIVCNLKK